MAALSLRSSTILVNILAFFVVGCLNSASCEYQAPIVYVDMDGPPSQRWIGALNAIMSLHPWEASFGPVFAHVNQSVFSNLPKNVFATVSAAVRTHYPMYYEELSALADAFAAHSHPEVSYEYLAAWAYYHSLAHANFGNGSAVQRHGPSAIFFRECTGVLAANESGTVFHGRNMDNEPWQLRNITVHFLLRMHGVVVAQGMDWYWSGGGMMTMFMPHVISLEENWRLHNGDINGTSIVDAIAAGAMSQDWYFREALFHLRLRSFDDIVHFLQSQTAPAPLYAIASGALPMQGAVITRDPSRTYPTLFLNQTGMSLSENTSTSAKLRLAKGSKPLLGSRSRSGSTMKSPSSRSRSPASASTNSSSSSSSSAAASSSSWFIVETNYDHWLPDPASDDRRTVAEESLEALGQNGVSIDGIYKVMCTGNVLNEDTVFTAVMIPATGESIWVGQDVHSP